MAISLVAQGRGHRDEPAAPEPFTGPGDFVSRFLVEQLVTFPRFVLSGGWRRAWSSAS
jgi:phage terminase small subunit